MCWYKLNDDKTVEKSNKFDVGIEKINETWLCDDIYVSTVFLCVDHNFNGDSDKPVLFETMVFSGNDELDMKRYHTYDEAIIGHNEMVNKFRKNDNKFDEELFEI